MRRSRDCSGAEEPEAEMPASNNQARVGGEFVPSPSESLDPNLTDPDHLQLLARRRRRRPPPFRLPSHHR